MGRYRLDDVPIVPATPLPETIVHLPVGLPIFHPHQELGSYTPNVNQGPLCDRLFDGIQHGADVVFWLGRPDEQVSVFGHDDVGPDVEAELSSSTIDGLYEPLPTSVFCQERVSMKTGEG
jgi:hypothetical protein